MTLSEEIGLKDTELKEIIRILSSFKNVERAIIYGSRAKGTFKPFSDIDLTIVGGNLTPHEVNQIAELLDDSSLPYLFDISDFKTLSNPDLVDHINRRGITVFSAVMH